MAKSYHQIVQEQQRKVKVIQIVEIEIGRMRRNYPTDAVEQEIFTRIAQFLKMIYGIYNEE